MNASDVTVIVLTCNRARYVATALASVRTQTWPNWELLLSDASTDPRSRAEVTAAFEHHQREAPKHRARLLLSTPGLVQADHLAAAWAEVRTPFIALLDDDDAWMPRHLAVARTWLDLNPRRGLSVANSIVIDGQGRAGEACHRIDLATPPDHDLPLCLDFLLRYPFSSTSGIVLRTAALRAHRFFPTSCVDVHLCISALLAGARVGLRPEPSFFYRVHDGSAYAKGAQAHLDRHRLRLHLASRHGWALTQRVPHFPLLVLKSALYASWASFRPAGHRRPVAGRSPVSSVQPVRSP